MAEQYNDAVEKLKNPDLREKYEHERRNFMKELAEASRDHPTHRRIHVPVDVDDE